MKRLLAVGLVGVFSLPVFADQQADITRIRESLSKAIPGETPDSITPISVPGFYEVMYGAHLVYVSSDGRYLFNGDLIDVKEQSNITEKRRGAARLTALEKVKGSMIVYSPKTKPKHVVTVFTDIDCGYCRKLHSGMKEMNELGIEVRYLSFPRSGVGTPSFEKATSVWCAKDPRKAMDAAKNGDAPAKANCTAPIREHLALGQAMGVNGTPALVLGDGRMLPGYLPPQRLLAVLEGKE